MKKKRVLPFILCLIIAMSLLSMMAFAEGFTDADGIAPAYQEAVEAMVERGVLEGYPDGSFRPEATLTREQGAKIITYLCIGKAAAEALRCDKAPFDDVAADRWSAPYIAWCVEHDILHGYGNGKYGPTDDLTGDQYAKMLLCALGLARERSAYTGTGWYKAVREDARAAGLYDGDPAMETNRPITRGQTALLSWNAVEAAETETPTSPTPAPSGGGSGGSPISTPTPTPGGDGDVETPEIGIDPDPTPPPLEEPGGGEGAGGGGVDDDGDLLLPEVP